MTAGEGQLLEALPAQLSSVQVNLNAKGEPQVSVKIYVGATAEELREARELAVETFYETCRAVGR
jgi:hypothetical protein